MPQFCMKLAGRVAAVTSLFESTPVYCEEFLTDDAPDFSICVSRGDLPREQERLFQEAKEEGLRPRVFPDPFLERSVIQQKITEAMFAYDALVLHGSVVAVDGFAYLFTAKCGTGKSTHTRLWRQVLGQRAVLVNDDKPILRLMDDCVLACGTPWMGKHGLGENMTVPLRGICILERGRENRIFPIPGQAALPMLLQQSNQPQKEENLPKLHALVNEVTRRVACYRMECNISPEAARIAYEAMSGQEMPLPAP